MTRILASLAILLSLGLAGCQPQSESAPGAGPAADSVGQANLKEQVSGLWLYTGLTTSDGQELPLEGIFLFKDGMFLQHAVFKGEPVATQGAMAHAGPYRIDEASVHLTAAPTISVAPPDTPHYSYRASTEHDITVARDGDALTLVFSMGTGTEQRFALAGPGEGELYLLAGGAFAVVDGRFILVQGTNTASVSGYGTVQQSEGRLLLTAEYWTEVDEGGATNHTDFALVATLDDEALSFEGGGRYLLKQ